MKYLKCGLYVVTFLSVAAIGLTAEAGPLVDVQILGSTTYSATASGYTSTVIASPGTTVYYAAEVQSKGIGAQNGSKTISTITYGTDGILSLSFNLNVSSGTFNSDSAVQAPFTDSGSNVYNNGSVTNSGSTLSGVVGSINTQTGDKPQGVSSNNAPTLALVQLGSLVDGSTAPSYVTGAYSTTSGVFKINNGQAVNGNSVTVSSGDPSGYYEFDELTIAAPEPASLGLLAFGGLALMRRRRTNRSGVAKV